ncbi:hypothetical protein MRB53_024627 [Persea americana]|uniref:Uncharacterized protein n=1 Tax=Persea americana TaxID=3435 RepID=A0ACC2LE48_PERAE|nr:hypothetical protein MRB53_024627 [Persea americana]
MPQKQSPLFHQISIQWMNGSVISTRNLAKTCGEFCSPDFVYGYSDESAAATFPAPEFLPELTDSPVEVQLPMTGFFPRSSESSKKSNGGCLSAQSMACRQRRKRISEKIQELGKLIPGGNKMNTAEMLQAAFNYMKYLQAQVGILELMASFQGNKQVGRFGWCVLENSYNLTGEGSKHTRFSEATIDLAGKGSKHSRCTVRGSDLTVFFEGKISSEELCGYSWLRRGMWQRAFFSSSSLHRMDSGNCIQSPMHSSKRSLSVIGRTTTSTSAMTIVLETLPK